jgi:hypothetical protein
MDADPVHVGPQAADSGSTVAYTDNCKSIIRGASLSRSQMSHSRFLLITVLVLGSLALLVGSYEMGRRTQLSHDDSGVYYTQAMLAFGHYKVYGSIADYLEKKCYDAALTLAQHMRDEQVVLLADNLRRTGNDPTLLEYIKLRDPELLKSVLAGHTPELRTETTTCLEPANGRK